MRRPAALLALAAAVLAPACAPALRDAPAAVPAVAAASCRAPRVAPADVLLLPPPVSARQLRPLWWDAPREGTARRIVAGGLRVAIVGDTLAWSDDRFAAPIVAAVPVAAGWVFVAADGTIATSDTFTGLLHRLDNVAHPLARGPASRGRVAVIDDRGVVFATDGRAPAAPFATLPAGRALTAVFADARRGAVILEGERLLATSDGGTSWQPVPLHGEAAVGLRADGDALLVATTAGPRALVGATLRETTAAPTAARADDDAVAAETARFTRRLGRALLQRYPGVLARDYASEGVPRPDGALVIPAGRDVRVLDRASSRERAAVPDALPTDRCVLHGWGTGLAALCADAAGASDGERLYHSGDGETFTDARVAWPPSEPGSFSDDEVHAVYPGPCVGNADDVAAGPRAGVYCVVHAEAGLARAVDLGDPAAAVLAAHNHGLLVGTRVGPQRVADLRVFDTEHDRATPLQLGASAARVDAAQWLQDGTVTAVAALDDAPDAPRALAIGAPDQPLAVLPLPRGAVTAGFADADHGVAAGRDLAHVWRTRDGGATWTPVPVAVTGSPASVALDPARDPETTPAVRCDGWECTVGDVLRIRGFGPLRPPRDAPLAATEPPALVAPAPARAELAFGGYVCEQGAALAPETATPAVVPPDAQRTTLAALGATATLAVWRAPQGHRAARLVWHAEGPRGATHGTVTGALPVRDDGDAGALPRARYALRAVGTAGVALERCVDAARDAPACQVFWASPRAGFVRLADGDALARALSAEVTVAGSLAASDGGALLRLSARIADAVVDRVIAVRADGRVTARRTLVWRDTPGQLRVLARVNGQLGYAVETPGDARGLEFYAVDGAPPTRLAALPRGTLRPCRRPRDSDAADVVITQRAPDERLLAMDAAWRVRSTVEVSSAGACLRAVDGWPARDEPATPTYGLRLAAASDGTLAGAVDTPGNVARRAVRCAPP